MLVLTLALLLLLLLRDLFGSWPEGADGAYGLTAWLALACWMLLVEIRTSRDGVR